MSEVDYTETHGRGLAISTSRQGIDHTRTGEVAHVEMDDRTGLLRVHFRDDDQPGGGIVCGSVHTFRYIKG